MEAEKAELEAAGQVMRSQGKVVLATVKGDVHDIGKNIVGVVLACNNYEVFDMGVMVSADKILARAREEKADIIGLSGLITPSLDEMATVAKEMPRAGFKVPLLIGGATTSKAHTAVKIDPHYDGPVVHVLDASRAVPVTSSLLSETAHEAFIATHDEEYAALRAKHGVPNFQLVSIDEARDNRARIEWSPEDISQPDWTGTRVFDQFSIETLRAYIDWSPFFRTWDLKGTYPKIFESPKYAEQAKEVFRDANDMLDKMAAEHLISAKAVYGIFPANAVGDDVELYTDASRTEVLRTFRFLRQQRRKSSSQPHLALSDFVAPKASGLADHVGAFAVTSGLGLSELVEKFKRDGDDYSAIMAEAVGDRLAEAFAEYLHKHVRQAWGYGKQEQLTTRELIHEKYRGIRPAAGYPACPDHTEKADLWELLDVQARIGMTLTESFAMWPGASVSGLYFAHPQSKYFSVGKVGRDQIEDYARRKQMKLSEIERWLGPILNYDPVRSNSSSSSAA